MSALSEWQDAQNQLDSHFNPGMIPDRFEIGGPCDCDDCEAARQTLRRVRSLVFPSFQSQETDA